MDEIAYYTEYWSPKVIEELRRCGFRNASKIAGTSLLDDICEDLHMQMRFGENPIDIQYTLSRYGADINLKLNEIKPIL